MTRSENGATGREGVVEPSHAETRRRHQIETGENALPKFEVNVKYYTSESIVVEAATPAEALDRAALGDGSWIRDSEQILDTVDASAWSIWDEDGNWVDNPLAAWS